MKIKEQSDLEGLKNTRKHDYVPDSRRYSLLLAQILVGPEPQTKR
jgi:hypothetical protein